METQNHYKLLKVEQSATIEEIKASYRKLAKETHPDSSVKPNAALFIKITESYDWLLLNHIPKKPQVKREQYYREFKTDSLHQKIFLPEEVLMYDARINCVYYSSTPNLTIDLDKGTKLPVTVTFPNLKNMQVTIAFQK